MTSLADTSTAIGAKNDAHAVRRHRQRIERVAKALLAKTTISGKQLDRLVGRSIDELMT
jgi:hypothetical protein